MAPATAADYAPCWRWEVIAGGIIRLHGDAPKRLKRQEVYDAIVAQLKPGVRYTVNIWSPSGRFFPHEFIGKERATDR